MATKAAILACLVSFTLATSVARELVVHESRATIPNGFIQNGLANGATTLRLRAALVQNDIAGLEKELYAVSDPSSVRYGQHLTKEQVEEFVKPAAESVSLVNQWFSENGISSTTLSPAGDWLELSIPVVKANELLDADFQTFTHIETGRKSILTMSYSIPANLKGHLDLIHPTITFPRPISGPTIATSISTSSNSTSDTVPSPCNSTITPKCLQDLYGIPSAKATQSTNVLGVFGYGGEYANKADLQTFLAEFRPDLSGNTFALQTVDGGKNPQVSILAGVEAGLDTQYTIGVASGVPVTFYSVGLQNNLGNIADAFLDLVNFLLAENNPPNVFTTSYGDDETDVSPALANQVCNAFMQLGARGTSVLFASGDGGVAGGQGVNCTTFVPTFPSDCPFVTSVGATVGISETAGNFSSGGFSDIFPRPSYQSHAVSSYLQAIGNENAGLFNKTGRGIPDVSAQGVAFEIVYKGQTGIVSGTSASSPSFASIIALLNDELIGAGKSPLGFLNPLFYTSASAFNDITTGNNPGCNTSGFPAKAGWDPVTGLGTPNFAKLRAAVGL